MKPRYETVDITPDTTLMPKMGRVGFTAAKALGELVDNSIDARLGGLPLLIQIELNPADKTIVVKDDAAGMSRDTAIKAVTPAVSEKTVGQIGQFGFGLKAACNYLARRFELVTATASDNVAYRITYDRSDFLKKREWKLPLEIIDKTFDHGTTIVLSELEISLYARLGDKVREYIGRTFRFFLRDAGVTIEVNGVPVAPVEIPVEEKWDIDWTIKESRVRGWVGVRKSIGDLKDKEQSYEGDNVASGERGLNGLTLARHNRVMRYGEWVGIHYHPTVRLLTGELHLDDFPVNVNKTDFLRDTDEWQELENRLGEFYRTIDIRKRVAKASRRVKVADKNEQAKINQATERLAAVVKSTDVVDTALTEMQIAQFEPPIRHAPAVPQSISSGSSEALSTTTSAQSSVGQEVVSAAEPLAGYNSPVQPEARYPVPPSVGELRRSIKGVSLVHQTATNGPEAPYKHKQFSERDNRLIITSNIDHPVYSALSDSTTWVYFNVSEALAEHLTELAIRRDPEMSAAAIWRLFNRLKDEILRALGEEVIESTT
jgi:hypothetical protein